MVSQAVGGVSGEQTGRKGVDKAKGERCLGPNKRNKIRTVEDGGQNEEAGRKRERKKNGGVGTSWSKHVGPTPCVSFSSALGCLPTISHRMSIEPLRSIQRESFRETSSCRTEIIENVIACREDLIVKQSEH